MLVVVARQSGTMDCAKEVSSKDCESLLVHKISESDNELELWCTGLREVDVCAGDAREGL